MRFPTTAQAGPGVQAQHRLLDGGAVTLGLGLGASSYVRGCRCSNVRDLDSYMSLDFAAGDGEEALAALHARYRGLRRRSGWRKSCSWGCGWCGAYRSWISRPCSAQKLTSVYGPVLERLKRDGLIQRDGVRIALTEWGMDVSNFVLSEFLL